MFVEDLKEVLWGEHTCDDVQMALTTPDKGSSWQRLSDQIWLVVVA